MENLLEAWAEFVRGKKNKRDVQKFSLNLMDNIFALRWDLTNHTYKHGPYQAFKINDPKPRDIHKASVRDRLLHHAICRILYLFFDRTFISDSFSCRLEKGTLRSLNRFRKFAYIVSRNNTRTCWVLKCDIRKFFANINHDILLNILNEYIPEEDVLWMLGEVIGSFKTQNVSLRGPAAAGTKQSDLDCRAEFIRPWRTRNDKRGLPLGNLTSQLFANIYLNKLDQFVKHKLKTRYYIRYADDFVIFSDNRNYLENLIPKISEFLKEKLKLELHPDKVSIQTLSSGADFLGWTHFPNHRVLRTSTKRRMLKRISGKNSASYLGMLKHGNGRKIKKKIASLLNTTFSGVGNKM